MGTATEPSTPRISSGRERSPPGFLSPGSQGHRLCFGAVPSAGLPKSPTWAREARLEEGWQCNFKAQAHSGAMETWGTTPRETPGPLWSPFPAPSSCLTWGPEGEENVRIIGYEGRDGQGKEPKPAGPVFSRETCIPPLRLTERRPLAGRRGQAFRFPWMGGGERTSLPIHYPLPPTPSTPRPKLAEADPKGNPGCSSPSGNGFPKIGP